MCSEIEAQLLRTADAALQKKNGGVAPAERVECSESKSSRVLQLRFCGIAPKTLQHTRTHKNSAREEAVREERRRMPERRGAPLLRNAALFCALLSRFLAGGSLNDRVSSPGFFFAEIRYITYS